jgi:phosphoesterase RecJ-like protein
MLKEKTSVLINIDHHLGNSMYGNINLVNPSKSATAEMIYELIEKYFKDSFNYNIAAGLYTGILTDTGRFQYENTSNNVHKVIGYLLEFGVQPSAVYSCIYENEPFERFGLIKLALRRIRILKTGDLIYSYVLQKDFKKLGLPFSANDGIIELLRTASGVKIAALIKQVGDNNFKVSLRSSDRQCSVADIAVKFGGGGHRLAAAYSQEGNLKNIIRDLISAIKSGSK